MKEIRERGRERGGGQEKRKEGETNLRQRDRRLIIVQRWNAKDSLCQNKCMYFINVLLIFNYWYVKVHINCISVYKKDLIMLANFKALHDLNDYCQIGNIDETNVYSSNTC